MCLSGAPGSGKFVCPSGAAGTAAGRADWHRRQGQHRAGRGWRSRIAGTCHRIWIGDGVDGITSANLTIRDFFYHPIIFNGGTQNSHVYNVHLINKPIQSFRQTATEFIVTL